MFVKLVYDINECRVAKVMKTCRKYLNHIQNSVFEGELSTANFTKLQSELKLIIKKDEDSIIIYKMNNTKYLQNFVLGIEKEETQFL